MYEERAGNSGVWQQVQRKINGEINDAISNGRTTLNTYRSLHIGVARGGYPLTWKTRLCKTQTWKTRLCKTKVAIT